LLAFLVLGLAFLMAAAPVRNGDFWMHLATGREIAQQRCVFGNDPFSYTTAGIYWANHAWLFDWAIYECYRTFGGAGVVIVKAVTMFALAALLLLIRRSRDWPWLPLLLTTLVFVVISPRLLLQPALVSFLLLGLALFLLWKGKWTWLLPLCILWVNVDAWFWLGPILVGLFSLGQRWSPAERTIPVWWAPACLLACLINPHHVHAFLTPPVELSLVAAKSGLSHDIRFQRAFISPWQQRGLWSNPAGIGYFVLFGISLLSLILNRPSWRDWRLLVWLAFAGLGAWQLRTVPFFAIVAGPIAALNFQELLERLPSARQDPARQDMFGFQWRLALVVVFLGVGTAAWTGWLQNINSRGRAVGLSVEPDSSLQHVAETIGQWRKEKKLPVESRGFAVHPDVSNYCAWFCPEETGFLDNRLNLFAGVATPYEDVCQQLLPGLDDTAPANPTMTWQQVFRDNHVDHVIIHDPDPVRLRDAFDRMSRNPRNWKLMSVSGQAIVFGWMTDETAPALSRFSNTDDMAAQLAYGAGTEHDSDNLASAPSSVPESTPKTATALKAFSKTRRPVWESAAADICMRYYDNTATRELAELDLRRWGACAASLIGSAAPAPTFLAPCCNIGFHIFQPTRYFGEETGRRADWPLLTIRACRRALLANPEDANAYLRLAQAYLAMRDATAEGNQQLAFPALATIRDIQIANALKQAANLNPDHPAVHQRLFFLFDRRGYLDAALEHQRQYLRIIREAGPAPTESPDLFDKRIRQFEKGVEEFERIVQNRQNDFAIRAQALGKDPLAKAQLALSMGLANQALDDILLNSRIELFGTAGARLQLELMLLLGRASEVRAMLAAPEIQENKLRLGVFSLPLLSWVDDGATQEFPAYNWFHACQAMALGDYEAAVTDFETCAVLYREADSPLLEQMRRMVMLAIAESSGSHGNAVSFVYQLATLGKWVAKLRQVLLMRNQLADLYALQGMARLELGPGSAAEERFQKSLNVSLLDERQTKTAGQLLSGHYWKRIHAISGRE
jgi:hypothetical protein